MRILLPSSDADFASYFHLRWEILRAPWRQPIGSERDIYDATAFHVMAVDDDGQAIGVGRLHEQAEGVGQIRYMAVRQQDQFKGIGSRILMALEEHALKKQYCRIVLNARDSAVNFYLCRGYLSVGIGQTLFGLISHTQMQKELSI